MTDPTAEIREQLDKITPHPPASPLNPWMEYPIDPDPNGDADFIEDSDVDRSR